MNRREPPFKPGDRFQQYQLRRLIGSGGQGFVYEAYDEHLDHVLAIKIVPTRTERASDLKLRARTEARILFRLHHRNIVEFHNAAATDEGMVWMAMELLSGRSLRAVLNDLKQLEVDEALLVGTQIAEGMQAAHANETVHRDLKPDNVFVEPDNVVKILDFGIAKITGAGAVTTQQNVIQGTLQYMSPEHLQGKPVTAQSDIFALGCVLYELIAGRAPALIGAEQSTQGLIGWNQMSRVPPRLDKLCPHVPIPVANAIQHMIAKEPANRPLSMEQVARELKTLQSRYTRTLTDPPRDLWRTNLPPRHVTALGPELPVNTTEPDSNCGYFEDSEPAALNQNSAQRTEPLPLLTPTAPSTLNDDSTPVRGVPRPGASQTVPERRSLGARLAGAVMPVTITARRAKSFVPRIPARWWAGAALLGVAMGLGLLYGKRTLLTSTQKLAVASATAASSRARSMVRSGMTAVSHQNRPTTPAPVASTRPSTTTVSVAPIPSATVRERPSPVKPASANPSASKPPARRSKRDLPEPPFKLDEIVF